MSRVLWTLAFSALYVLFALPLCAFLSRRRACAWWWWAVAVLGGVGLPLTLLVQPHIQRAYTRFIFTPLLSRGGPEWLLGFGLVWVSGLVQELLKLGPVYAVFRLRPSSRDHALAYGAAAGVGFAVWEAVQLVALPLGVAAARGAAVGWLGSVERLAAVNLHLGVSAAAAWGLARGRFGRYYLAASLLHGAANYGVILLRLWVLTVPQVEIWVGVWAAAAVAWALWLARPAWGGRGFPPSRRRALRVEEEVVAGGAAGAPGQEGGFYTCGN